MRIYCENNIGGLIIQQLQSRNVNEHFLIPVRPIQSVGRELGQVFRIVKTRMSSTNINKKLGYRSIISYFFDLSKNKYSMQNTRVASSLLKLSNYTLRIFRSVYINKSPHPTAQKLSGRDGEIICLRYT